MSSKILLEKELKTKNKLNKISFDLQRTIQYFLFNNCIYFFNGIKIQRNGSIFYRMEVFE